MITAVEEATIMVIKNDLSEYKQTLLDILPDQGCWSEGEYLGLTDHLTRLVEYTDGYIEILPMPTSFHQALLRFLFLKFHAFVSPLGGEAFFAPLRLRIRARKFREPDLLLVKDQNDPRYGNRYWTGADLTLEVVSEDNPERDLIDKRHDYAEGKVPEYWIVNPLSETITVLRLKKSKYVEHGVFKRGESATSALLPGFKIRVSEVFDIKCPPDNAEGE